MENQAGTHLEATSLLASLHGTGGRYACDWRREVLISFPQLGPLKTAMTGLTRYAHWRNSGINVTGLANHFLIGSEVCAMRWNSYLALLKWPRICG